MPKKTKEEKRKAAQRKYQLLFKEQQYTPKTISTKIVQPSDHVSPKTTSVAVGTDATVSTYFKKDLVKSLTLISAIIALEIILYYGTINNYFSILKLK